MVAPPSSHASGGVYEWIETTAPAPVPDFALEYARGRQAAAGAPPQRPPIGARLDVPPSPPPWSEAEEARIRSALACVPATDYDDWIRVGMGLHWTGWGAPAFQLWDEWSRTAPEQYKDADVPKKWESFGRSNDGKPVTLGTLFRMAKDRGWIEADYHADLGNARKLVARHGANIRFVSDWRKWIMWEDTHWRVDDDGAIDRLAKETVNGSTRKRSNWAMSANKRNSLNTPCGAKRRRGLMQWWAWRQPRPKWCCRRNWFDADPWLLGLQNGVLDLRTGTFRPAAREDFITKRSGVAFDPNGSAQMARIPRNDHRRRSAFGRIPSTRGRIYLDRFHARGSSFRALRYGQ